MNWFLVDSLGFLDPLLEIATIIVNTGFISFSMSQTDSGEVVSGDPTIL